MKTIQDKLMDKMQKELVELGVDEIKATFFIAKYFIAVTEYSLSQFVKSIKPETKRSQE